MTDFKNINLFKKNSDQIFCRNLFVFLILLKYKNKSLFKKSTIFIKPYKRKIYTILRSPYRHKLARHQIILNRYNIVSTIKLESLKIFNCYNFKSINKLFFFFKKFNYWFESNIVYNYKIKYSFKFYYNINFNLTSFNKK